MKTPLTVANLSGLIGKKIQWNAEANRSNSPYKGECIISKIDLNNERPIISNECISGDDIKYAFIEDHTLIPCDNGYTLEKGNGSNNCLSYSDSFREIFYEVVS